MLADENLERGSTPQNADSFARRKLGNRTAISEAIYEMRPFSFLDAWVMHLRIVRPVRQEQLVPQEPPEPWALRELKACLEVLDPLVQSDPLVSSATTTR
jgi:hypothetical protein